MAKKTRMGRNLNALLGGATRNRPDDSAESNDVSVKEDEKTVADAPPELTTETGTTESGIPTLIKGASAAGPVPRPAADTSTANQSTTPAAQAMSSELIGSQVSTDDSSLSPMTSAANLERKSPAAESLVVQADSHPTDRLRMLGVDQISRGTYQPRRHFDQELLQELADSIKAQGLIQPILVRAYGGKFELIAGERRWRAAQLAGITDIPAIVREMDDQSVAAVSLIENIQRADLNPLEEAQALERLCDEFTMTHQQVAEAVGRSRVAVTNLMRLLELHDDVKSMVDNGELDMGHARALLGAPRTEQASIAKRIVQQGLTVRAVEKLVKDIREGKSATIPDAVKTDPNIEALGQKLGKLLGAPVSIKHQKNGSGKLEISYSSIDELDGILTHIK